MADEDEWVRAGARPVSAGSDDAADPWIAAGAKPADAPQSQTEPQTVPDAFVDRVAQGEMLRRETDRKVQEITNNFDKSRAVLKAFGEGFGDRPLGFTPESVQELRDLGMFRDPATGRGGPIRVFNEVALNSAAIALDVATRTAMGGIHAIGEMGGQIADRIGLPETEGLRREIRSYLEYEMQRGDHTTFSRPHVTPDGQIVHQQIGTLPKTEDFQTAAKVLDSPAAERNLKDLWTERGIHPAEAVHDAQGDAFLKHQIAPPSFTAFHGSPHDFDSFDTSRIGTGEGAQAYGHGLYFAESEAVAKAYRDQLVELPELDWNKLDFSNPDHVLASSIDLHGNDRDSIINDLKNRIADSEAPGEAKAARRALARVERGEPLPPMLDLAGLPPAGHLYETTIHADKDSFLDWDKPFSQQSEYVLAALKNSNDPIIRGVVDRATKLQRHIEDGATSDTMREAIQREIDASNRDLGNTKESAAALRAAGIPGIKYLDQGSRAAGEGTRNYVVFDHNIVEVTKRDGVPLTPTELPPVRNSPMPEGTPRSELAKTGEPHIDQILDSPVTKRVVDNPVVDREHTVPYTAGGSVPLEDPTVFIDHRFPTSFTVDGVTFDPADPFVVHENVEQHVMDNLIKGGMDAQTAYKVAHFEYAEKAEGAWYRAHGIDQAKAEAAYAPFMAEIQHEGEANTPPNLYTRPYPHDNPSAATHEPIAEPKPTKAEIAQAKKIMADQASRSDLGKSNIETAAAAIARSGAQPYIGELRATAGENLDKIIPALQTGKNAQGRLNMVTQNLKQMASKLPDEQTVANALKSSEAVKAAIETKNPEIIGMAIDQLKSDLAEVFTETDKIYSVGADVTRPENLPPDIPPSIQRTTPVARLTAAGRANMDQLMGLGRNIQYLLDPMSTGSDRAMVLAKDAMNSVRRIRWDYMRRDADLTRKFNMEQLTRMWNALDEESVLMQDIGRTGNNFEAMREHMGLATLEPELRTAVEEMMGESQGAWLHAQDVGMVEGDGLPAYAPRMMLNMAAGTSGELGPRALNELGRNVFTRTAQMKHRNYLMAEETEAAAKRMVADQMAKRGASVDEINEAVAKVQIARNIRTLPLATARLAEAAVWRDMINKIEDIGKASDGPTVAVGYKPDNSWFTIAGNPAFTKWTPDLVQDPVTKSWSARVDQNGNTVFVPKPIYMSNEFRGPMNAILDEGASQNKLVAGAQTLYGALMTLKGKSMTAILNSPLIHNEVVWSKVAEAAGMREWAGFGLYFRGSRIVQGIKEFEGQGRAQELIERGLNPIGPRGSYQDITAMMQEPDINTGYHKSWTGQLAGFIPGLFDEGAGKTVERAIAKAGDFTHNTLLWNRVRDVQFGLADYMSDKIAAGGVDRMTADRIAAHFSNIIVGSIPKEAMSASARATANMLLFSRSFTLGNLATFKQAVTGLPKPILAQIARDHEFLFTKNAETGEYELPAGVDMETAKQGAIDASKKIAQGIARRKAISTVMLSAGLMYIGNALIQNAMDYVMRDQSVDDIWRGYARRFVDAMSAVHKDPFELRHLVQRLSPTWDNEPEKQDRAYIGNDKNGTAIYARNPTGKFGEEMVGYPTMPITMLKRKLSPLAGGILDVIENDSGFGHKIWDKNSDTLGGDVKNAFNIAKYIVLRHLPAGQMSAGWDLLQGDGDARVNAMRTFGPMAGFTVSEGGPGGQAHGEQLAAKSAFDTRFNLAWPDIRKQIQRGDVTGAQEAMRGLGVPPRMQAGLIRNAMNPAAAVHGQTLKNFLQYATPEQIERFERARQ